MMVFEALSGIKMNLEKTAMYPINLSCSTLDQVFKCKWGTFPITYLGLPLVDTKLQNSDRNFLIDKVKNKLQHWKGQLLSSGGRLTLVNSVLSSVPLYALSIFKIPTQVLKRLDCLRRKFLW